MSLTLPAQHESVTAGRHLLSLTLAEWGLRPLSDAVALAASEILTNAVVHARTAFELTLLAEDDVLVSVRDTGPPWAPEYRPVQAAWDDEQGRGVALVAAVSDAWGVQPDAAGGKTVWFRVALS